MTTRRRQAACYLSDMVFRDHTICSALTLLVASCANNAAPPPKAAETEPVEARRVSEPSAPAPPVSLGEPVNFSEPESAVRMTLHTTATAAVPGSTFWVAAHFQMAPGYRIFWVNPGDVGKKTVVHFDVPIGFESSEVRFVAPTKFELSDGGRSFGYENETAAFAEVRALPDLRSDEMYRFEVEAKWLACKQRCLSESAKAFIEFSVEPEAEEAGFEGSLARLFHALPQPLHRLAGVKHEWRAGTLSVSAREGRWLDFFPANPSTPRLTKLSIEPEKNELLLSFEGGAEGSRVKGLAVAEGGEGQTFVTVDLPYEGPKD